LMETNIYRVSFGPSRHATPTQPMFWSDIGWRLKFDGVDLPESYEVYFAHPGDTEAKRSIGGSDGALVLNEYLTSGKELLFWVYVPAGENAAHTKYTGRIPVNPRPAASEAEPTPEQADVITQTIAALNAAVEQTAADVEAADLSAQEAAAQADRAETAQEAAEAAQTAAETAERNAALSATAAGESEAAARTYAQNAARSESNAEGYAEDALESANLADERSRDAADSAETAGSAASDASGSAASAAASATTAGGAASTAATAAESAASSAASASGAASQAAASETAAAGSKADAETAAQSAASSATIATTKAEEAAGSAEAAAEDAEEIRALGSGIATEPTAEQILAQVAAILPLVQEIAENGMGGGSLNGFSLSMGENGEVILSYTNPEDDTDTDSATMPTASTGAEVIAELQSINSALTVWANRGNT